MEVLGNRSFMFHHAEGFPQYVMHNAYEEEEQEFKKPSRLVPIQDFPLDANFISNHAMYKIKIEEGENATQSPHCASQKLGKYDRRA